MVSNLFSDVANPRGITILTLPELRVTNMNNENHECNSNIDHLKIDVKPCIKPRTHLLNGFST